MPSAHSRSSPGPSPLPTTATAPPKALRLDRSPKPPVHRVPNSVTIATPPSEKTTTVREPSPLRSVFSVGTCSRCSETVLLSAAVDSELAAEDNVASETGPLPSLDDVVASVARTVSTLDTSLRNVGQELHELQLKDLSAENLENQPPKRQPLRAQSENQRQDPVHPLLADTDSIKRLAGANIRLLKTLMTRVDAVAREAKQLREQREELNRERQSIETMRREFEEAQKNVNTSEKWVQTQTEESATRASQLRWDERKTKRRHTFDATTREEIQANITDVDDSDADSVAIARTSSNNSTDSADRKLDINEYWSQAQEEVLQDLERRLRAANKHWSSEQEDVLEMVEPLREQKRLAKKAAKKARRGSGGITTPTSPLPVVAKLPFYKSKTGSSVSILRRNHTSPQIHRRTLSTATDDSETEPKRKRSSRLFWLLKQ